MIICVNLRTSSESHLKTLELLKKYTFPPLAVITIVIIMSTVGFGLAAVWG